MAPKIAVITYSTWGHVTAISQSIIAGIKEAGGEPDLYQVKETLAPEVVAAMYGQPQDTSIPFITPEKLTEYDGFILGMPTRFGNMPAQWKTFWDGTMHLWQGSQLRGKYAGLFVCTAHLGGGHESTYLACLSTLAHHGILYVPLGYAPGDGFQILGNVQEVRGGSPWGSGSLSSSDGSRTPTEAELKLAHIQGHDFYKTVAKAFP